MASAVIRPFKTEDDKLARFMVAKSNMEQLAMANRRAKYHPLFLGAWVAFAAILVKYMQWWPDLQTGLFSYLRPLPILAATFLPLMFAMDWINRPYFEQLTQDVLRAPDMRDVKGHYSRAPGSGFWILEFGQQFVGLIALDASADDTSRTAIIRHFYVQEPYPSSGIASDLLSHAVDRCFNSNAGIQEIKAGDSPLVPYTRKALQEAGFVMERTTDTVGVFGWKLGLRSLQRDVWEKKA
ncbi:hypothetical protein DFH07DRAFT_789294 [Mycena maculata]|uniref:N-acetyltransferase domain-containing protein n=1 Tax=Mycena maculata TaxID=230809 RepID=A0AAD7KEB3_9AGAR|nr:hypothetical protein DFH07DRAFT_789294 [Mycena maculata]